MVSHKRSSHRHLISGMFLVAGTCIGGGMLALPVATGISGFLPSLAVMAVCWLFMTITALLLLEVSLWMEEGVHVITMTSRLLGRFGEVISWILFLFISYASIMAYTAGGGVQIATVINNFFPEAISKEVGALIFLLLFGVIVDLGAEFVGRINSILFVAMIIAYVCLVGMGVDEVNMQNLAHNNWPLSLLSVPLILTTFSFQTMVPSLTPYLQRNAKDLRWAIIGGTTLTLLIYVIWQFLILGIVPVKGEQGLTAAFLVGEPATTFLQHHVNGYWVYGIAEFFAFFAMATSFLGIGLGLFDFLADGLKVSKKGMGKLLLAIIIMGPTIIFATQFERIFLTAMEFSGGIGDSILNGIFPVLMVWIGRYHLKHQGSFRLGGGKPLLILTLIFYSCALIMQGISYFKTPDVHVQLKELSNNNESLKKSN